jgi:hypothetical protein
MVERDHGAIVLLGRDGTLGSMTEPTADDLVEALTRIERGLANATFRLGRLRHAHRGSALHRDLTAISYDVTGARRDAAALLDALSPPPTRGDS